MSNIISSLLFNCKISNFYPPIDDGCKGKEDDLGMKKFTMMFGDKKIKWEFRNEITYKGIKLYFKLDDLKVNNFYVRITCMIPRLDHDGERQKVDAKAPMYIEHVTNPAHYFNHYSKTLSMKYEKFANYDGCEGDIDLDMFIKIELMEEKFPKESNKEIDSQMLLTNYADLYRSGNFSDFTITCSDGVEIPVHRIILAVNSPILKMMMSLGPQESGYTKLKLWDIDGTVMDKILLFMYTQNYDEISKYLKGLLYGAKKYQIDNLMAVCVNHMFDNLCVENAVEYFMLSNLHNIERLKQLCLTYIQIHYDALSNTETWKELNVEQLELIEKAVKDYKASQLTLEFAMNEFFWDYES